MGNPSTTERDSARMGYGKVLAIDSYCGCCADWHEVTVFSKGPLRRGICKIVLIKLQSPTKSGVLIVQPS